MRANLLKQLRQVRLFAALEPDDLKAIAQVVKPEEWPAGSVLGYQGQPGVTAYILESGELRLSHVDMKGHEEVVGTLLPGAFFGETSLLLGEPRDVTIEVTQASTLLALNKAAFDRVLKERPLLLKALQIRPDVLRRRRVARFKWQDPDELVVVSLHKHDVRLALNLVLPVLAILIVLASMAYLFRWMGRAALIAIPLALLALLVGVYLTIDHFNDHYIVTSKRVVHDERHLLLRDLRTEAPLRAIQNVQLVRDGLLARIFNLGDLIIETAGERGHVVFRQIADPEGLQEIVFQQIARVQAAVRAEQRATIRAALQTRFGDGQSEPQPALLPESAPAKRPRRWTTPRWVRSVLRAAGYFLPPLRIEQGDTITWRKHWVALIRPLAFPTLWIVVVTVITAVLISTPFGRDNWQFGLIVYGILLIFLMPWWLWRFEDWKNDIYQITATRIIDIERLPFYLRESRREASLGMIQNVNLEIPSLAGKLLNYGSVTIETAGAGPFTFDLVKDPRSVQTEISRRMDAFQRRQQQEAAQQRRDELLEWFAAYDKMRDAESSVSNPQSEPRGV